LVPLLFSDIGNNEFAATVHLSQLPPTVLANNSPIKGVVFLVPILCVMYMLRSHIDMGGRIYREGKSSKASRVQLGTIVIVSFAHFTTSDWCQGSCRGFGVLSCCIQSFV
jgi:hypothetical protein